MRRLTGLGARALAHGKLPAKQGTAKARPPQAGVWERMYLKRLKALNAAWADHVETVGRAMLDGRADGRRADGPVDDLRAAYLDLVKASGLEQFLGRFAGQISDANKTYVQRVTKLPPGGVARQQVIEEFRRDNVRLIKGLADYQADEVAGVLREAQAAGARWEETVPAIKERLGVSLSRAKLIARDQTNKFNGAMQQAHQTASGITEYRWKTAGDMVVRGRPGGEYAKSKEDHWALEGTRQRWDMPPLIPGTSVHAHPGKQIQCRCQAIPIVEFFEEGPIQAAPAPPPPAPAPRAKRRGPIPFEALYQAQPFRPEDVNVGRIAQVGGLEGSDYLRSGYRPESFTAVRAAPPEKLPSVSVDVYPNGQVILRDGRHRLAVALERGEPTIRAHVLQRNARGNAIASYVGDVPTRSSK